MAGLLRRAAGLVYRALGVGGGLVRDPCPQCCGTQADKMWLRACSCQQWNPADWSTGDPCAAPRVRCMWVCVSARLNDDLSRTIAERLEEIGTRWGSGSPFVVQDEDGFCYRLEPIAYEVLPEGGIEIYGPGETVPLVDGCNDESCAEEPMGDAYVKFTSCYEGVSGDWWGCRARLPMSGLRFIGASCWCITQTSQTSNTITGTLLTTGNLIDGATCCSCKNRRNSVAVPWSTPNDCDNQPEVTGVVCSHGDLRRRTTSDGAITTSQRCCCGQCADRQFVLSNLSYTETASDIGFSYSGTMTNIAWYRSDSAGNPSTWDNYITITYDFVTVTNGAMVTTPTTKTISVRCAAGGYPHGPGSVTGSTSPLHAGAPFPLNIGTVSGSCSTTTYSLSTTATSGTLTQSYTGTGTVTITASACSGCGSAPSGVPGASP